MSQAKQGDSVKIHYTGRLDDGTVFDSSKGREPLEFKLGEGQVIPGFEVAVLGMATGDTKTARIEAEDAYGPHREEMVLKVEKGQFPEDIEPQIGQQLQLGQPGGEVVRVVVTEVSEADVTLDANHPLAGKALSFDIELVEIGA